MERPSRPWREGNSAAGHRPDAGGPAPGLFDYTLPAYDGMSASACARAVRPGAPFLLVSGSIGADRAARNLKSGAAEIVFKDHWEHLAPAVRNALREARRDLEGRRVEEVARAAESRSRGLGEFTDSGSHSQQLALAKAAVWAWPWSMGL